MRTPTITRHELARRRGQLSDLQAYVQSLEGEFGALHQRLQEFVARYTDLLGPLYLELDALESQLHLATSYLSEALRRNGVDVRMPMPPKPTALPQLPTLPAAAPLPHEPQGGMVEIEPPSLKQLYRRAAMRLHPDLARSDIERLQRETDMIDANAAYAAGDRPRLERLLLRAGEDPLKVTGSNGDAVLEWLRRSELGVQGRLRVVQAHLLALQAHPMHQLLQAISQAEAKGLDPMAVMASRLRTQIAERRQELYIGQRLQPESSLAQAFLHQRIERMGAATS
ncbi:hypothetical protein RQP53_04715 [Paucibacter sp. APW11]|uniref:J domain-containing protein n=1 Tax=Roseateles aquae TaxID=3077235 RepID=A0ABU3P7N8_9BURK|nr:hypothetical protein [Paucibacter sp. APW11]MDT8998570.1 hypothetical protein [Paucibacter sp. APW11]